MEYHKCYKYLQIDYLFFEINVNIHQYRAIALLNLR